MTIDEAVEQGWLVPKATTCHLYRGERVEEMSREELIAAVIELGEMYVREIEKHRKVLDALNVPDAAKYGRAE